MFKKKLGGQEASIKTRMVIGVETDQMKPMIIYGLVLQTIVGTDIGTHWIISIKEESYHGLHLERISLLTVGRSHTKEGVEV